MNFKHFGDSYDIVKQSLLMWLSSPRDKWFVHPMFTDSCPQRYAADYCRFLGVPAVTTQTIRGVRREIWIRKASACPMNLFLDPDTGITSNESKSGNKHIRIFDLIKIVKARPGKLTLVFDQSFANTGVRDKLEYLHRHRVWGLAYDSYAKFFLVSTKPEILFSAKRRLLQASSLPKSRLIVI